MRTYTLTLDIPETIDPDEARALCAEAIRDALAYPEKYERHPFIAGPKRWHVCRCGSLASARVHFDQLTGEAL